MGAFEWFYSAVDAQWFEKNEFVEYLNYVTLDILPRRLTRSEWSIIRCALGRPRRLSDHFLKGEREKLYYHRESVRRSLAGKKVLSALPYPFLFGKKVLAYFASTREFHDGILLSIDHNICRVQFDWPEKRVENVMDINCMLLGPHDNFPRPIWIRDSITGPMSKLGIDCDDGNAKVLMAYNVSSDLQRSDESSDMLSHMIELLNSLLQEAKSMVTKEFRERINRASSLETDCILADTDKPTNLNLKVTDSKPVVLSASKHFPVELISSCLATLMMIQNCSEHKYPPDEEVKKLHLALKSLHPGCPENLLLHQPVKQLMGIIKS